MKNVGKVKKQMFGAVILLFMIVLAIGTVVFAENSDSYALVINKKLAKGSPEKAREQEYRFRLDGVGIGMSNSGKKLKDLIQNPEGVTVNEDGSVTVSITGEGSKTINTNGSVAITVSEVADGMSFDDDNGQKWNMSTTECETNMPAKGTGDYSINIGKDGGSITLSKKEGTTSYYRITKKDQKQARAVSGDVIKVEPAKPGKWENLPEGLYTVEELKGSEGFALSAGEREVNVQAGQKGEVHINGAYGELTITAPGTSGGSEQYYYDVINKDDSSYNRTVGMKSGETYKLEHLPSGTYSVEEHIYSGKNGFEVKVPQTIDKVVNKKIYKSCFTAENAQKPSLYYFDVEGEYIDTIKCGPLRNNKGNTIKAEYTYSFSYGALKAIDSTAISYYTKKSCPGNKAVSTSSKIIPIKGRLYIGVWQMLSKTATELGVSWVEHNVRTEEESTCKSNEISKTVDDRGWMEITKQKDSEEKPVGEVYYDYLITDEKGNPIKDYKTIINGVEVSDNASDATVRLNEGDHVRLEGLAAGTYRIVETVHIDEKSTFTIKVKEEESLVSSGNTITGKILGKRTITIKKAENKPGEGMLDYDYKFVVTKNNATARELNLPYEFTLKAGEEKELTLDAGEYTIEEKAREAEVFYLKYNDSSTVGLLTSLSSGGQTEVTFTNSFAEAKGSYHVIHEYYLKDDNGRYQYEGSSPVSSVGGLLVDGTSYVAGASAESNTQLVFTADSGGTYSYIHFDTAYGSVETDPDETQIDETILEPIEEELPIEENKNLQEEENTLPEETETSSGEEKTPAEGEVSGGEEQSSGEGEPLKKEELSSEENGDLEGRQHLPEGSVPLEEEKQQEGEVDKPELVDTTLLPGVGVAQSKEEKEKLPDENVLPKEEEKQPSEEDETPEQQDDLEKDRGLPDEGKNEEDELPSVSGNEADNGIMPLAEPQVESFSMNFDERGIIDKGIGKNSEQTEYFYSPEDGKDSVVATEKGKEIIILRYYREKVDETPVKGTYKVLHIYYFRGPNGDIREGTSKIIETEPIELTEQTRKEIHTADQVNREEKPTVYYNKAGNENNNIYSYTYDGYAYGILTPGGNPNDDFYAFGEAYTPDTRARGVYASAEGNQIIILRYYREERVEPPEKKGSYRVVHEYYYRKKADDVEGEEDPNPATGESGKKVEAVIKKTTLGREAAAGEDSSFVGTLVDNDEYTYTFEGISEIDKISAPLGYAAYAGKIKKIPAHEYNGVKYNYVSYNSGYGEMIADGNYKCITDKTWAASTETGEQIVILRYVRGDIDEPAPPDTPNPPDNPDPPDKPKPPEEPEIPPEEPEIPPENPGYPTELPDPNDPDSPDRITIWEDGVPKTYVKVWDPDAGKFIYILDEEVPMWGGAGTGDESDTVLWLILSGGSLCALGMSGWFARRRKENR